MPVPRFSLRWLLGSITFLTIGCGLLVYARPVTAHVTFGTTLLVLFTAIPLSVYRSGARRAFWFGFALFGLGYLGIVCGPWQAPDVHIQVGVRERLSTTKLLELAYEYLPTKAPSVPMGGGQGSGMFGQMGGMPASRPTPRATEWGDFAIVGHSLWALVTASFGGAIAYWCHQTGRR
jgi:hypothetical protein